MQRRATGSWSRVVLLGRRIRDIKLFADVDVGLGRSTESSITGALCSPSSLSDNHAIAVLLCLCRRLFLHVWKSEKGDDSNRQFTDYETWFRDVVGKNKGKLVEGLMKPLTELVPLEPLNFLRVHHRIFSMKRDYFRITSDYLVLVRSRISDLDPSHNRGFLANADSNMGKSNLDNTEVSSKTIEHVVRFVVEFSEKKKLSPFLVRQMNFHRYHFRANTLPVLLDPNLVSRIEEDKVAGLTMNIDTFEKHRICLIKELAFKRKDQAVVASEATPAVKAIQESTKKRKEHMKEKENKSDVAVEKPLYDLDSPLQELFSSTLRKTEAGHGSEKAFLRDSNYAKSVLLKKLKGAVKDCKQESDYSSLAVNILQNLISAIIENDVGNVTKNLMHLQKNGCSSPLQGYREWWWSIGTLMQPLLRDLFGDPEMRCLQKQLQYQLFALVCIRGDCVSTKAMRAVALLTSTLMKLRANVKLSDICYTVTDTCSPKIRFISSIMFDCLPLNEAKYVVCSARFAFHYSSLLLASGEEAQSALKNTVVGDVAYCSPSIDDDKVPLPPFPGPNPPLNLLRWVVANPWRLFLDEGMNEETVRDKLLSGNLAWFLKDIAHLLTSSEADINGGIGVCTYLEFEGRCRWGRANAVYTAFRGFEEAGMCRRNLINEAAACIARCQFSTHASCEWIEQGLVRFSEERPSCLKGEPKDNEEENFSAQFVEHCIDEDGPHYSLRMIGIFSLVECCYFHGCVLSYVKHHLEIILLPCFWPLSRQHARFLLTCLNCPSLSGTFPNDENALDISFLMVSNFIVECNENELENWNCNRSQKGMRSKCQSENIAIDHMTGIKSAVKALMLPENEKNTQNPNGTQGFGGIGCVFESFHQSIASSLVLHFVKYYMYAKKDETRHVMRMCCRQLSIIVSGLIAGEVIDVAMSCAALLPFSGRYAARGDHEAALSVMNVLLEVLIDERLQLVDAGAPCPHWVLNFLEAQVDDDDSRMIILSWLGKADEQAGRRRLCVASNLPVSICMGRILGVVNSLCEERISVLVSEAGEDAIARSLLPNMLTVYKELSETLYNRRGTLTSESHARLLGCREHVRCGVVDAFVRIVSNMWERGIERFEDFIGRVFVRFPDVDEEIKVVLRARNVLL